MYVYHKAKVQSPAIKLKNYDYMYFEGCRYIHVCKFAVEVTMEDDAPLILEVNNPHVPGRRLRSRLETLDGLPVPKGTYRQVHHLLPVVSPHLWWSVGKASNGCRTKVKIAPEPPLNA